MVKKHYIRDFSKLVTRPQNFLTNDEHPFIYGVRLNEISVSVFRYIYGSFGSLLGVLEK